MRAIYKPAGMAGEYAEYAINIYSGCSHGCYYCFAPSLTRKTRDDFKNVVVRDGVVNATKQQLVGLRNKTIHLCFTCDPYPYGIDTTPTTGVIEAIKSSGNNVQLLSKAGYRSLRDLWMLGEGDWYGTTISCGDNLARTAEPLAAPPAQRIGALRRAHEMGIKTWVSLEPVIEENAIYGFLEAYHDIVDLVKIGKLNYHPSTINWRSFGKSCEALCQQHGVAYVIKESLRKEMV